MVKNYGRFSLGLLVGVIIGVFVGRTYFIHPMDADHPIKSVAIPSAAEPVKTNRPVPPQLKNTSNSSIPREVLTVVEYIQSHHAPMDGYVGGRIFSNRENLLPQRDAQNQNIRYQEWDVHPKIPGQNRDADRIVTGSDGRKWYSNDHYQSFTEIK